MSLLPLRRWSPRPSDQPACQLPVPGPFPIVLQDAIVIFVVVLIVVVWLLAHGYSDEDALRIVTTVGALTASIASRRVAAEAGDDRDRSRT